jgi:hypothetical protein
MVVDADFAEFVHDHRYPPAVVRSQNAIKKRRLTGAQKTCEDCHRDALIAIFPHVLEFPLQLFSKGNNELSFSQLRGLGR